MLGRTLMIQGTASHVGKSVLTAGFCRLFARQGYRVAPFKAQNMSLNSYVTLDGKEIGRSTAYQAHAAGVEPTAEMNPVLLKPSSESGSQVILMGEPVDNMDVKQYHEYQRVALPVVELSLLHLRQIFDLVVMEGAGSPAEINLYDRDIVNMKSAEIADAPVILVGDIERGGVFASLYGTMALLRPADRRRVKGLIINKFRGDELLLTSGIEFLEHEFGIPVLGVLPYLRNLSVEEEDSLALDADARTSGVEDACAGAATIGVIRLPYLSNFTDFDALRHERGLCVRYVSSVDEWGSPDLVIVPGTKSTIADLQWMRENGLAKRLIEHAVSGGRVLGICGGYQMLGREIADSECVEFIRGSVTGLGLLDVSTRFEQTKTLRRVSAVGRTGWMSGVRFSGYEIHHGVTDGATSRPFAAFDGGEADGAVNEGGNVMGTYLHGLFDSVHSRAALRASFGASGLPESEDEPTTATGDSALDRLADCLSEYLDMDRVLSIIGPINALSKVTIFDPNGALLREYLLNRGYCCESGCRNCPYGFKKREIKENR